MFNDLFMIVLCFSLSFSASILALIFGWTLDGFGGPLDISLAPEDISNPPMAPKYIRQASANCKARFFASLHQLAPKSRPEVLLGTILVDF